MTHITREKKNVRVDALVEVTAFLAIMQTITLHVYYQYNSSILENEQVSQMYDTHGSWMEPIIKYLEARELPEDELQAHHIRINFARYNMIGDQL